MPAPMGNALGKALQGVSLAAEEAAEEAVDRDMPEPGRTMAVASTHVAILVALLREESTREELGPEVADTCAWCYLDVGEILDAALLAVTGALGTE